MLITHESEIDSAANSVNTVKATPVNVARDLVSSEAVACTPIKDRVSQRGITEIEEEIVSGENPTPPVAENPSDLQQSQPDPDNSGPKNKLTPVRQLYERHKRSDWARITPGNLTHADLSRMANVELNCSVNAQIYLKIYRREKKLFIRMNFKLREENWRDDTRFCSNLFIQAMHLASKQVAEVRLLPDDSGVFELAYIMNSSDSGAAVLERVAVICKKLFQETRKVFSLAAMGPDLPY